ncbi:MAG TPA: hypothetical protein VGC72_05330 [Candidatus Elarobacter sp.]|jgi:hypothetical protein
MLAAAVLLALASATFQPVTAATTAQPPQVFVRDASAQPQTGDNPHDYGIRPPGDNDSDAAMLYNAHNESIHTGLGTWRTADGTATFEPAAQAMTKVHTVFHRLIPNGRYSLFVRQIAGRAGAVFTPLDLIGATNNFTAGTDGSADFTVNSPLQMPSGSQLVLVFHSDGADHQSSIGVLGTNAHPQLITRVP